MFFSNVEKQEDMKYIIAIFSGLFLLLLISLSIIGIMKEDKKLQGKEYRILFLHHSTGDVVFNAGKTTSRLSRKLFKNQTFVKQWFKKYNASNNTNYKIEQQFFPKNGPYGWNNYPYDYYNIWVKHAGNLPYLNEPTLEILTQKYNLIIFKHCYPVSDMVEDSNLADINSSKKSLENYKLQYLALKQKMHEFPDTKFLVWTGAARVESNTTTEQAKRAKAFFDWVRNEWDTPDDNIFLWDFYELETEGTLYLKNENASDPANSHPGKDFAEKVAPLFCQRIIEVIGQNH
jgi:hypothetical protein